MGFTFHAVQLLYVVVEGVLHFDSFEGGLVPNNDKLELNRGITGFSLLEEFSQLLLSVR